MTVCIPWTNEDVDYLVNEGFKDTYLVMKNNPKLRIKFQKAANVVKDRYSQPETNKFQKQHLIDTYYDIVDRISKRTHEEWANYEREYQEQLLNQECEREALQEVLPLIEKAEKSENFRDFVYNWREFANFVSKSKHQDIYDVKEYAASRIYHEIKQNRNIRTGLEAILSKRLGDNTTIEEFVQFLGIDKEELRKYCIDQKHNGLISTINNGLGEMQTDLQKNESYDLGKFEYFNNLLNELNELYRENGISKNKREINEEAKQILDRAHEISSLYGIKLIDIITQKDPKIIARNDFINGFNKIKNIVYKNTFQISSKEIQKEIIKNISEKDNEYNKKIDKFAKRYLLKKQDQLYFETENAAENGNKALFETDFDVTHDSSGNLFVHPKIKTKRMPIFVDNSKRYENLKEQLMRLSKNYSIVLDEEPEDLENLEKTLKNWDKKYKQSCKDMINHYGFISGKFRRIPTKQELDDINQIYYKLIGQAVNKSKEAVVNKDKKKAREYLDLAKTLNTERKKDVDSLRQKRLEIIKEEETLRIIQKPKPANLESISAPKIPVQAKPKLETMVAEEIEEISEVEEIRCKERREQIKAETKRTEEIYNKYNLVLSQKHELTKEEAYQRANKLLTELQKQHQKEIEGINLSWNENKSEMNFDLKIKGIPVQGTAYLTDGEITLGGNLSDWRAKMAKGFIEKEIKKVLEQTFS